MQLQITMQIGFSILATIIYIVTISIANRLLGKYGDKQNYLSKQILYLKKIVGGVLFALYLLVILLIWGIDYRSVMIFASSFFAMLGIAFFASWSILSNFTTSFIIFFSFPYRIGDHIRVLESDNSVQGKIIDMTLFHVQIINDNGHTIAYPNNLIIQRPVIKLTPSTSSS